MTDHVHTHTSIMDEERCLTCTPISEVQRLRTALATIAKCPSDQLNARVYAWYVLENRSEEEMKKCFVWPPKKDISYPVISSVDERTR